MTPHSLPDLAVGVYAGKGASHSWLWFLDMIDRFGCHLPSVKVLDERSAQRLTEQDLNVFLVSGGDTFALAEHLGEQGARAIERFVEKGGIYWGSCAGAYLVLKSSRFPLNLFNFIKARIGNLTSEASLIHGLDNRFKTQYGCRYVVQPVREEVLLGLVDSGSISKRLVSAPLYGGPVIEETQDGTELCFYAAFTHKTKFMVERSIAHEMVLGKKALLKYEFGKGTFFVSGPHMEHPGYPEANRLLVDLLCPGAGRFWGTYNSSKYLSLKKGYGQEKSTRRLKSNLSSIRIMARSIEFQDVVWQIGSKYYDPPKLIVFVEALWKRFLTFEKLPTQTQKESLEALLILSEKVKSFLRDLLHRLDRKEDSQATATKLLKAIRQLLIDFFNLFYRSLKTCFMDTGPNHG